MIFVKRLNSCCDLVANTKISLYEMQVKSECENAPHNIPSDPFFTTAVEKLSAALDAFKDEVCKLGVISAEDLIKTK